VAYVDALDVNNFSMGNWSRIGGYINDGVVIINMAENKARINNARVETKKKIKTVPRMASSFPTVLEDFTVEDFTDEFFEEYAIIWTSLQFSNIGYSVKFHTVYIDNGELIILVENTTHPNTTKLPAGPPPITFIIIIPKAVFDSANLLDFCRVFSKYNVVLDDDSRIKEISEADREWLVGIQEYSVEHRVGKLCWQQHREVWDFLNYEGRISSQVWWGTHPYHETPWIHYKPWIFNVEGHPHQNFPLQ